MMRSVRRIVIGLLALVVLDWLYPVVWISLPMSGQVVDAVTKKAVAGAVVVATWRIDALDNQLGVIQTLEVTSDRDGRFQVPGWGPVFWIGLGHIGKSQPLVWTYAPEHAPAFFANQCCGVHTPHLLANTKLPLITVQPAPVAAFEYGRQLDELMLAISTTFISAPCEWKRIPKLLSGIDRARASLQERGVGPGLLVGSAPSRC